MKNQITTGQWVVRGIDRLDETNRQIHFRASGVYPDQDPYLTHFGRVNFNGTGLVFLTSATETIRSLIHPTIGFSSIPTAASIGPP